MVFRLSELRKAHGLTQDALADALGVRPSKIRDIEANRQRVNDEFVSDLIQRFAVDLNALFLPDGVSPPPLPQPPALTDKDDFALIPMYDAALAAGAGAVNGDNAPIAELAFQRKWLRSIGLRPDNACVARAAGDSMFPTISSGDMLLIDRSKTDVGVRHHVPDKRRKAAIYALLVDDQARVKRIVRPDRNTLILLSDNPDNLPEVLTGAKAEALAPTIIGQVRWSGHTISD